MRADLQPQIPTAQTPRDSHPALCLCARRSKVIRGILPLTPAGQRKRCPKWQYCHFVAESSSHDSDARFGLGSAPKRGSSLFSPISWHQSSNGTMLPPDFRWGWHRCANQTSQNRALSGQNRAEAVSPKKHPRPNLKQVGVGPWLIAPCR